MGRVLNDEKTHNGGVTENTVFYHVRRIKELKGQASAVAAKMKKAWKEAEEDGVNRADIEEIWKEMNMPLEERIASHDRKNFYRRCFKMPEREFISDLGDKIASMTKMTDAEREARWEDDGYVAGREGKNKDSCPHEDPNSMGARFWFQGWERGQAENAKGIKKLSKPDAKEDPKPAAAAAPAAAAKPRGRPKKEGGVTYWHKGEAKKVYEVPQSDAPPEGAVNITLSEYEKLKAAYEAQEKDEWDDGTPLPPVDDDDGADGDDGGDAPSAAD